MQRFIFCSILQPPGQTLADITAAYLTDFIPTWLIPPLPRDSPCLPFLPPPLFSPLFSLSQTHCFFSPLYVSDLRWGTRASVEMTDNRCPTWPDYTSTVSLSCSLSVLTYCFRFLFGFQLSPKNSISQFGDSAVCPPRWQLPARISWSVRAKPTETGNRMITVSRTVLVNRVLRLFTVTGGSVRPRVSPVFHVSWVQPSTVVCCEEEMSQSVENPSNEAVWDSLLDKSAV